MVKQVINSNISGREFWFYEYVNELILQIWNLGNLIL